MEVAVEPATASLVPDIASLARAARDELRTYRGGDLFVTRDSFAEPLEETLGAFAGRDDRVLVAGTVDGTAVGYAAASVEREVAVIHEIFVDPDARGVGVGEAMLDSIMEWARTQGCKGVDSYALPGARETKNFFETAGMKARLLVVHTPL